MNTHRNHLLILMAMVVFCPFLSLAEQEVVDLATRYHDQIENGKALLNDGVVSFYNDKLDADSLELLKIQEEIHQDLLERDTEYYMCNIKNFISGYPDKIDKSDRIEIPKSFDTLILLDDIEPIFENGSEFWRIEYDGEPYWAKRETKSKIKYIATYKECPSIQKEILDIEVTEVLKVIKEERESGFQLPKPSSGFIDFVCVDSGGLNAYLDTDAVDAKEAVMKLPQGAQVVRVQGKEAMAHEARDHKFVLVQVQPDTEDKDLNEYANKRFWVADQFLKRFEDCAAIQSSMTTVCSKEKVSYYTGDSNLSSLESNGKLGELSTVYKMLGVTFEKKIALDAKGNEVVYVPVAKTQTDQTVKWVQESVLNAQCKLVIVGRLMKQTSSQGKECHVLSDDNFPLTHPARHTYFNRGDTTAYKSRRSSGLRHHAAVDLYSYNRFGRGSRSATGGAVEAINDSRVTGLGKWKHTHYLVVASRLINRSWIYGEITAPNYRYNKPIKKKAVIGSTAQYVKRNSHYPAMLHLERYNTRLRDGNRTYKSSNKLRRVSSNIDPTCHVEFMSNRKFGVPWRRAAR